VDRRLPIWALIAPALLVALYALLIFVSITDQVGFYDAMAMPFPNHGFMHISWTGKTMAIWTVLLISVATRRWDFILLGLVGVTIQQVGDTIAGQTTNVDVFVTNIGLALSLLSFGSIAFAVCRRRMA